MISFNLRRHVVVALPAILLSACDDGATTASRRYDDLAQALATLPPPLQAEARYDALKAVSEAVANLLADYPDTPAASRIRSGERIGTYNQLEIGAELAEAAKAPIVCMKYPSLSCLTDVLVNLAKDTTKDENGFIAPRGSLLPSLLIIDPNRYASVFSSPEDASEAVTYSNWPETHAFVLAHAGLETASAVFSLADKRFGPDQPLSALRMAGALKDLRVRDVIGTLLPFMRSGKMKPDEELFSNIGIARILDYDDADDVQRILDITPLESIRDVFPLFFDGISCRSRPRFIRQVLARIHATGASAEYINKFEASIAGCEGAEIEEWTTLLQIMNRSDELRISIYKDYAGDLSTPAGQRFLGDVIKTDLDKINADLQEETKAAIDVARLQRSNSDSLHQLAIPFMDGDGKRPLEIAKVLLARTSRMSGESLESVVAAVNARMGGWKAKRFYEAEKVEEAISAALQRRGDISAFSAYLRTYPQRITQSDLNYFAETGRKAEVREFSQSALLATNKKLEPALITLFDRTPMRGDADIAQSYLALEGLDYAIAVAGLYALSKSHPVFVPALMECIDQRPLETFRAVLDGHINGVPKRRVSEANILSHDRMVQLTRLAARTDHSEVALRYWAESWIIEQGSNSGRPEDMLKAARENFELVGVWAPLVARAALLMKLRELQHRSFAP